MAARPSPHNALRLCLRLAKNSARRLEASAECTRAMLDSNTRLTGPEAMSYAKAAKAADEAASMFRDILDIQVPAAPKAPAQRKLGRPSKAEVVKTEARRKGARRPKKA